MTALQIQISSNELWQIYTKIPGPMKMVFVLVLVVLATVFIVKQWNGISSILKKFGGGRKTITVEDLQNHALFGKCKMWLKYKITDLYFGDAHRNRLFRIILGAKIQVLANKCEQAITPEIKKMNKHCFASHVFKYHTDMQVETQIEIRQRLQDAYGEIGDKIYALVVKHETKGFNAFNQMTDSYTECLIQIICDSEIYTNNIEKYDMILDAYKSALGAAFPHIETAFKGFNGELDSLVK